MSNVAFLGLGEMGSRMALNLVKAGHAVTVWNRDKSPVLKLEPAGIKSASSPREAAEGKDFVLSMVRDDDASRTIWLDKTDGALIGMIPDAIAIESSTLTPAWTQQLGEAMLSRGISLLEAPVSGSTPQAESAELIFLVGGEKNALGKAEHLLRAMGSSIQYAGPLGAGAYAKLVTNCLMAVQISTLAEMIGMLRHNDVDPEKVLNAVASTAIWNPHLTRDTDSMLNKDFAPRFPVKLLEKDLAYTLQTAGGDTLAPMTSAVRKLFQTAIGADLGDSHMTAIVKLFENDRHH